MNIVASGTDPDTNCKNEAKTTSVWSVVPQSK